MPLAAGGRAPYAPSKTIVSVIERHRQVGLPTVDLDVLSRIGVSEPLRPRTLASLKLLDFYGEDGRISPEFDDLKRVPSSDFPARLSDLLMRVYAPVIEILGDPSSATPEDIENAFRTFEPSGQRVRMVQLFIGLLTFAGVLDESAKRKPGPAKRTSSTRGTGSRAVNGATKKPPPPPPPPPPSDDDGDRTDIALGAAGTVALIVQINPLLLSKADREFLFGLIDKFEERRALGNEEREADSVVT